MKFSINTVRFQDMVSRVAKGASENKLLPITSMMEIKLNEGDLTLTTTDTLNTLRVIEHKVEGEDLYAVVPVEIFSKLIAKTTSEKIQITVTESAVDVKGNGTYQIPMPMDEDGVVQFPEPVFDTTKAEEHKINLTSIKNIIAINGASLSKTLEVPCLCGYYLGENVLSTDENVVCINAFRATGADVLISDDTMDLLSLFTEENITLFTNGNTLLFKTDSVVLYSVEHDGRELYPVNDIMGYLEETFPSQCVVPKILLQNVIDRLSLFIEPYDKNGAYFNFTKDGLQINSKKSSSVEVIAYQSSKDFKPFICCVDIPIFKAQVDVNLGESIELWYGHDAAIKITSGKVTQVIALLEDQTLGGN